MNGRDDRGSTLPDATVESGPVTESDARSDRGPVDADPAERRDDALSIALDAVYGPPREAWQSLAEHVEGTIVSLLERGLQRHREVVETIGLREELPTDWEARSELLLEYRRAIASDLLEPLTEALHEDDLIARITRAASESLSRSWSASQELPAEFEEAWEADALDGLDSDSFRRRFGKAVARVVSAARKAGETRSVPLRATVVTHVREEFAPALEAATMDTLRAWAKWAGELERAWVEWGDQALPALVQVDLPPSEQDQTEHWEVVRTTALALSDALEQLIERAPHRSAVVQMEERFAVASERLDSELSIAGSFLTRKSSEVTTAPTLGLVERSTPAMASWTAAVVARLDLYESVLAILSGATAVQRRLVYRVREKLLSGSRGLAEVATALDALREGTASWTRGPELESRLAELNRAVASALAPAMTALPDVKEVDATLKSRSDATVEALLAMVRQAPSSLVLHSADARPPTGERPVEGRPLAVQDIARQSFDALRVERIGQSTAGLSAAIEAVRGDMQELPKVFEFAYDAARQELDEDGREATKRAIGLVSEALRSIAESLRAVNDRIGQSIGKAQAQLANEISDGALALFDRVSAGRVHARLLAARSSLAVARVWVNEHWGPHVDRAYRLVAARTLWLWRFANRLVRRGSEMVSGSASGQAASRRTLQALSHAGEVVESLPLVYQRLFTFEPLDDGSMLAGRENELAEALDRWERWRDDDGVPLVVRGRPGSGITSYLNVLGAALRERGVTVARVSLDERIATEAAFAARVAKALELPKCASIDELSSAVFASDPEKLPAAILLDNLEHLYLRVPRGTDLVERVLTLMAETEPRLFWLAGVSNSAWQLIAIAEPSAVSQIDVLDLHPLTAEEMRQAIRLRHRRSGLPVHFDLPVSGRLKWRRRLRRLTRSVAAEDDLEADFFDQLYRTSSRSLRLGLFQWLLAADFTRGDGVRMTAPTRLDFSILEALGIAQNFTLKAFLEHRSLSLQEHDDVFRLPRHESYQIVESLSNRRLIEPIAARNGERDTQSEIEVDLRYRVRPLIVGAVLDHLAGRNIVH